MKNFIVTIEGVGYNIKARSMLEIIEWARRQALQMRPEKEVEAVFREMAPTTGIEKTITSKKGSPFRVVIREGLEK